MIVVKLSGGLGNQLFQYAFGRMLSFKHQARLFFDTTFYDEFNGNATPREYALGNFCIQGEICPQKILDELIEKKYIYQEKHYNFDPEAIKQGDNILYKGYWQSEKYFSEVRNILKRELLLKNKSSLFRKWENEINSENSLGIHIRRGDFVNVESTNKFHGVLSMDYYKKALDMLMKIRDKYEVFVFTDDVEWAKNNLFLINKNISCKFVSGNGLKDFEEMMLMSVCKYNIIANSSFSWWGAWLGDEKKIVIAPDKWVATNALDTGDVIPKNWKTINVEY